MYKYVIVSFILFVFCIGCDTQSKGNSDYLVPDPLTGEQDFGDDLEEYSQPEGQPFVDNDHDDIPDEDTENTIIPFFPQDTIEGSDGELQPSSKLYISVESVYRDAVAAGDIPAEVAEKGMYSFIDSIKALHSSGNWIDLGIKPTRFEITDLNCNLKIASSRLPEGQYNQIRITLDNKIYDKDYKTIFVFETTGIDLYNKFYLKKDIDAKVRFAFDVAEWFKNAQEGEQEPKVLTLEDGTTVTVETGKLPYDLAPSFELKQVRAEDEYDHTKPAKISYNNEDVVLNLEADADTKGTIYTVHELNERTIPVAQDEDGNPVEDETEVLKAFDFGPGTKFSKDILVEVKLDTIDSATMENANVEYFHPSKKIWVKLPHVSRDADEKKINFITDHFSTYRVTGTNQYHITHPVGAAAQINYDYMTEYIEKAMAVMDYNFYSGDNTSQVDSYESEIDDEGLLNESWNEPFRNLNYKQERLSGTITVDKKEHGIETMSFDIGATTHTVSDYFNLKDFEYSVEKVDDTHIAVIIKKKENGLMPIEHKFVEIEGNYKGSTCQKCNHECQWDCNYIRVFGKKIPIWCWQPTPWDCILCQSVRTKCKLLRQEIGGAVGDISGSHEFDVYVNNIFIKQVYEVKVDVDDSGIKTIKFDPKDELSTYYGTVDDNFTGFSGTEVECNFATLAQILSAPLDIYDEFWRPVSSGITKGFNESLTNSINSSINDQNIDDSGLADNNKDGVIDDNDKVGYGAFAKLLEKKFKDKVSGHLNDIVSDVDDPQNISVSDNGINFTANIDVTVPVGADCTTNCENISDVNSIAFPEIPNDAAPSLDFQGSRSFMFGVSVNMLEKIFWSFMRDGYLCRNETSPRVFKITPVSRPRVIFRGNKTIKVRVNSRITYEDSFGVTKTETTNVNYYYDLLLDKFTSKFGIKFKKIDTDSDTENIKIACSQLSEQGSRFKDFDFPVPFFGLLNSFSFQETMYQNSMIDYRDRDYNNNGDNQKNEDAYIVMDNQFQGVVHDYDGNVGEWLWVDTSMITDRDNLSLSGILQSTDTWEGYSLWSTFVNTESSVSGMNMPGRSYVTQLMNIPDTLRNGFSEFVGKNINLLGRYVWVNYPWEDHPWYYFSPKDYVSEFVYVDLHNDIIPKNRSSQWIRLAGDDDPSSTDLSGYYRKTKYLFPVNICGSQDSRKELVQIYSDYVDDPVEGRVKFRFHFDKAGGILEKSFKSMIKEMLIREKGMAEGDAESEAKKLSKKIWDIQVLPNQYDTGTTVNDLLRVNKFLYGFNVNGSETDVTISDVSYKVYLDCPFYKDFTAWINMKGLPNNERIEFFRDPEAGGAISLKFIDHNFYKTTLFDAIGQTELDDVKVYPNMNGQYGVIRLNHRFYSLRTEGIAVVCDPFKIDVPVTDPFYFNGVQLMRQNLSLAWHGYLPFYQGFKWGLQNYPSFQAKIRSFIDNYNDNTSYAIVFRACVLEILDDEIGGTYTIRYRYGVTPHQDDLYWKYLRNDCSNPDGWNEYQDPEVDDVSYRTTLLPETHRRLSESIGSVNIRLVLMKEGYSSDLKQANEVNSVKVIPVSTQILDTTPNHVVNTYQSTFNNIPYDTYTAIGVLVEPPVASNRVYYFTFEGFNRAYWYINDNLHFYSTYFENYITQGGSQLEFYNILGAVEIEKK